MDEDFIYHYIFVNMDKTPRVDERVKVNFSNKELLPLPAHQDQDFEETVLKNSVCSDGWLYSCGWNESFHGER